MNWELLLIEWRDAREAIFKTDKPTPQMFTRLGAAELALMTFARGLPTNKGNYILNAHPYLGTSQTDTVFDKQIYLAPATPSVASRCFFCCSHSFRLPKVLGVNVSWQGWSGKSTKHMNSAKIFVI